MTTNSQNSILDGSNLLGNLDFLNSLNEGRNLLHTQLPNEQKQQHQRCQQSSTFFQSFVPKMEPKFDVFAQLQQLVSSGSNNNSKNSAFDHNNQQQQQQQHSYPKHQPATQHNKLISREKKKFSSDVSDFLVLEVLKRKELLVENNTSRDLSFSECKRNAWNNVKELLVSRFSGFDLNIEAIKSHWRYRKRKVTDAFSEMCKGGDTEQKLKVRLAAVDFEIYSQLKDSNLLERSRMEMGTSPEHGDDGHFEHLSASNSPTTKTGNADSAAAAAPTMPMVSQAPFFLSSLGQQQQQIAAANPTILLERLTANLLEQQLRQQQMSKSGEEVRFVGRDNIWHSKNNACGTQMPADERHDGTVAGSREQRSQSASTTMSNLSSTAPAEFHVGTATDSVAGGGCVAGAEPAQKRLRLTISAEDEEAKEEEEEEQRGMALLKREAYMAQASAFDEIQLLVTEVRSTLLPQMLTALQNYNSQFRPQNY